MSLALLVALQQISASPEPRDAGAIVALEVPAEPPERVVLATPLGALELVRHSVRAPGAFVRVWSERASADEAPPPARTYRGVVQGAPGSLVTAALDEDGWSAFLETVAPDGARRRHALEPLATPGLHRLRVAPPEAPFACGAADEPAPAALADVLALGARADRRRCLALAEIAFDADFEYFQRKGSSVPDTVAAIDAILNQVELFYARDVQITFALTAYVVRTTPFYTPTSGGDLLDQFRVEWTTSQAAIPRDLAHLMTGKPGSLIEYGGLAYVGVVCNAGAHYGWSMDGANIVGHEVGHNFGAGHCHDLDPCNNMCGACFYVGPETRRIMSAFRDAISCLDPVANRPPEVPPYAMRDAARGRKDRLAAGLVVDVLANDDDGDCQPLLLAGADAVSERGGTVRALAAVQGGWRERLEYSGPAEPFVGTDRFAYEVADARSTSSGEVLVESAPLELLGYWPLDELAGQTATDASRGGRDGTLAASPTWDPAGRFGGAIRFDGINDRVHLPALDARTDQLTITCWVKRDGPQDPFAGIVFSRAGSTVAGLHVGTGNELRYTWDGEPGTYSFPTSLVLPDGQWAFAALVVERERATLYLRDGALRSATRVARHAPEAFDGRTVIGRDDLGGRHFQGWIDDVRVYAHALDAAEIAVLAGASAWADAPLPRDGGKVADPASALEWLPGLDALAHDVYLGTSWAAVRAATPAAAEFRGTLGGTSFAPGALVPGTTYFWRVDEHTPAGVVAGPVWQYAPARFHRWPLDEATGSTAADVELGSDGTYLFGVLQGQPGATASLGSAASFDGVNDRVSIPALQLDSSRVTITCWLKRNGAQNGWAGLVFSRAGSTVAGLHFGTAQELRYTWNDDGASWGWDSGLVVPDQQWVFAALVVEPSRATLHLGQGGVLASAVNAISHATEAFDGQLWLARDPSSSARHYRGLLDDVRVYDHALTVDEVRALYLGSL